MKRVVLASAAIACALGGVAKAEEDAALAPPREETSSASIQTESLPKDVDDPTREALPTPADSAEQVSAPKPAEEPTQTSVEDVVAEEVAADAVIDAEPPTQAERAGADVAEQGAALDSDAQDAVESAVATPQEDAAVESAVAAPDEDTAVESVADAPDEDTAVESVAAAPEAESEAEAVDPAVKSETVAADEKPTLAASAEPVEEEAIVIAPAPPSRAPSRPTPTASASSAGTSGASPTPSKDKPTAVILETPASTAEVEPADDGGIADKFGFDDGETPQVAATSARPQWSGGYVGGTVAAVETKFSGMFDENDPVGEFDLDGLGETGLGVGVHGGYLWSTAEGFVLGFEVDVTYIGSSADVGILDTNPDPSVASGYQYAQAEVNWAASVRGRAGYAFGSVLPYVTGGLGLVDYKFALHDEGGGTGGGGRPGHYEFSRTLTAPVIGGGVEWALGNGFSVRAEGMIYMIGDTESLDGVIPDSDGDNNQQVEFEDLTTFRAGFSYEF